jgi:hypothetical protein
MTSNAFNPDTDIPSLAGKVIFITGGKHQYNSFSPVFHWQNTTQHTSSSAAATKRVPPS